MHPFYEKENDGFDIFTARNRHFPPHLHPFLECVYLQKGTLAIGQGTELFPMQAGDFALIFPNTIHHYQVFGDTDSRSVYLMIDPLSSGVFQESLLSFAAKNPVIASSDVDPEIRHALREMIRAKQSPYRKELCQAYLQIILSRSFPLLELIDKELLGAQDLVYEVMEYMASHYKEEISLGSMAEALGISPYVLSRVFSGTFHSNFNTYLNEVRLKYAIKLLKYSTLPITEVAMESGFSSLRTFNRFCQDKLRMTPREYRDAYRESLRDDPSESVLQE